MPIVPVFDPTTGASGGPSGGGGGSAGLYDVAFTGPINLTDGTWTLLDPDNLIQSISYAGGYHTVVWNALAAGSSNYNWANGATHRGPRWYKAADIDGNQLTTDDIIQAVFYAQTDNVNRGDFDSQMVHGICVDPTSTAEGTIAGCGLITNCIVGNANTIMGVWTASGQASTAVGASDRCITTYQYGGRHTGSGTFTIVDPAGIRIQNGSRNASLVLPATTNLHWIVGLGTRTNSTTIGAGDESQRFKIYRAPLKTDLAGVL